MWHTNCGDRTLEGAEAQALKDFMRMRDDYFLEIPEDLKPKEIETKLSELKTLCQSICGKSKAT